MKCLPLFDGVKMPSAICIPIKCIVKQFLNLRDMLNLRDTFKDKQGIICTISKPLTDHPYPLHTWCTVQFAPCIKYKLSNLTSFKCT